MGNLNSDTNRVHTVMHKRLKCDADEAKQWIKDRSAKLTFDGKEEKLIGFNIPPLNRLRLKIVYKG